MEYNKIIYGDAYKLIKEIPDHSIDLIYTDIPYLSQIDGGGIINQNKILQEQLRPIMSGINYEILDEFCRICKKIFCMIWCSKDQIVDISKYFVEKGCSFNLCVWCKTNPTPLTNNTWLPDLEYCLIFKESGAKTYNDGYDLKSKWYLSQKNVEDKKSFIHPTIKPLELVKRHIKHCCDKDSIVLDPFAGSGTTLVACKELGIKYLGFEINEKYYNIAKDRLNGIDKNGQMSLLDTDFEQLDLFNEDL